MYLLENIYTKLHALRIKDTSKYRYSIHLNNENPVNTNLFKMDNSIQFLLFLELDEKNCCLDIKIKDLIKFVKTDEIVSSDNIELRQKYRQAKYYYYTVIALFPKEFSKEKNEESQAFISQAKKENLKKFIKYITSSLSETISSKNTMYRKYILTDKI